MATSMSTPDDDNGGLDFELTDFDSARQALEELPPGVAEVKRLQPGYWEERRRAVAPTDRALAGVTLDWMAKLPPTVRPARLAERYPRVANQLAQNWASGMKCAETFNDLLVDQRGGRHGFPYDVEAELKGLKEYRSVLR
jgi:hypothetical protein